jgi:acetyl esterase/lipase
MRLALVFLTAALAGCVSLPKKTGYALFKNVVYHEYADTPLIADIYEPQATNSPIVMVIHGGGWNSRSGDMQAVSEDLAKQGFLVYAVTYRLTPKYIYPAQIEDMKSALKYIHTDAPSRGGDVTQIYVWGYSAGGYLALMTGLDPENGIKGIVTGAAPTDLSEYPKSPMITKLMGKTHQQDHKLWDSASPVNNVRENSPPVFMYHGTMDGLVDIDQMYFMKEKLEEKKVPVTVRGVGGLGHVSLYLLDQKSVNLGIQFLLDLVKKNAAPGPKTGTAQQNTSKGTN